MKKKYKNKFSIGPVIDESLFEIKLQNYCLIEHLEHQMVSWGTILVIHFDFLV